MDAVAKTGLILLQGRARLLDCEAMERTMQTEASDVLKEFRQGNVDAFETLFRLHQRAKCTLAGVR